MGLSLRAFAAAVVVATTTGLLVMPATATSVCEKVETEWRTIYSGPFGEIRVPVPTEVHTIGCVTS